MLRFLKKYKYVMTIFLFMLIIFYIVFVKVNLKSKEKNLVDNQVVINEVEKVEVDLKDDLVYVDIKGAVKKPGVYKINSDKKIIDVITIAGGLMENANTDNINLSKKVTDEMVIIIYTDEEVKNSNIVDTVIKVIDKECVCPNIQNDGCINTEINDSITNVNNIININTATLEELMSINGLGEAKAKAIIKYREENGYFKIIDDLLNVSGIGEALFEKIKEYITT
ncbi:putative ComE operon protein 1 [Clostridium sp. CAG:914]|nr:putative ComE operon protein 1 [Clostridium sp. CAG:914]